MLRNEKERRRVERRKICMVVTGMRGYLMMVHTPTSPLQHLVLCYPARTAS